MEKQILDFDTVILGGGPAGLSASIYTARGNLKTEGREGKGTGKEFDWYLQPCGDLKRSQVSKFREGPH